MKTLAIFSVLMLFSIISLSPAFADHSEVTVVPADGSGSPGCEKTADGCYIPSTATVDVGGVVIMSNTDTAGHTYTSGNPEDGPDGIFDSSLLMTGNSFEWSPDEVGEYDYYCMVHPWMLGTIIVQEVSAEEDDVMEQPMKAEMFGWDRFESMQDPGVGHEEHQLAILLAPSENTYAGTLRYDASEPIQLVSLRGPLGSDETAGKIWTPDGKTKFELTLVDQESSSGEWDFSGNALAVHTFNTNQFVVDVQIDYEEIPPQKSMMEEDMMKDDSMMEQETMMADDSVMETTSDEAESSGGGCLIATAAYGTELAPQVQFLREIRDNTVMSTASGASFMTGFNQLYYSFSPTIADLERENPMFKESVRAFITPMISTLSIMTLAEDGSEAEVLGLGISVIALNLAMYIAAPAVVVWQIKKRI
ncbi:cupredoxin domain-containing protein [Nitrosopumilus maritimus]|uniref:cupredoxin domain-containing protein n=1 Tax=Nitrosopumilus maritimus TaxID=338192 RepID=UPI001EE587F6|nr:CFI-box-CTERM domain-containing protein [Nitrosopumilus maritimus]